MKLALISRALITKSVHVLRKRKDQTKGGSDPPGVKERNYVCCGYNTMLPRYISVSSRCQNDQLSEISSFIVTGLPSKLLLKVPKISL